MEEPLLELEVTDEVKVTEVAAPSTADLSVVSTFFLMATSVQPEIDGCTVSGMPRGPSALTSVTISEAAF